jgi:hypothetical protein
MAPPTTERPLAPPVEMPSPSRAPPIESEPARTAPPPARAAPSTVEPSRPEAAPSAVEPSRPQAAPSAVEPSRPQAAPARPRSLEPEEEMFKPRSGSPAEAPRIDLDAAKKRAVREMAHEGAGSPGVLPFPLPIPEKKTKEAAAMEKAIKPDCRTAYAGMGLLAVPALVAATITDEGCRW